MPVPISSQHNGANHSTITNSTLDRAHSQWLFTQAELLKSPSIIEGLPVAQELSNRQKGVNFITQVGIMLKLPQLTLATASVYLHRFYMRYPMQVSKDKGIHHYQVAATALFLATKVEENCRKMKELIVACCRVAQKDPNSLIDEQSKEYWKWRDTILYHEDLLLESLCFDLQLEQPYRILFDFLCYYGVQDKKNLRNTSWAFLNDSHITTMCLLHSPKTVAGSALYAGIKLAGVTLPDDEQGRPWWQHLELDIAEIQSACNQMADIYENPIVPRQGQKDAYVKDEDVMSFERTRRTQSPSFENSPAYSHRSPSQGNKREREDSWGHEEKNGHDEELNPSQRSGREQAQSSPKRQRTGSATHEIVGEGIATSQTHISNSSRTSQAGVGNGIDRGPSPIEGRRIPLAANVRVEETQRHGEASVSLSERSRVPSGLHREHNINGENFSSKPSNAAVVAETSMETKSNHKSDAQNSASQITQQPTYARTHDVVDAAEEVDYGSEEGEV